jgi:hypothetical protein
MGLLNFNLMHGLGFDSHIHPFGLGRFFPSWHIQDQSPGTPGASPGIVQVSEFIVIQLPVKFINGNFNVL